MKNLHDNNQGYKEKEDKKRIHKNFEVGYEIMVLLKKNKFLVGTYSMLKIKKFGCCRILKKNDNGNAFEDEWFEDMDILLLFNILYIFEYYEYN